MTSAAITLDIADGVGWLTLARPDKRNAIDLGFAQELEALAEQCATDPAIRVAVLTGRGKFFSVGGDVAAFAAAGPDMEAAVGELARRLHIGIHRLVTMEKPLVTAINGPAAGAGLGLAIMGDIAIAAASAHFTSAYSAVGLTPDAGVSWWLPRLIGLRRAQEMVLTNRRISADEAVEIGLVTRVVPDEQLRDEVTETAMALAAGPLRALTGCSALLREAIGADLAQHLDREASAIASSAGSAEGRKGVAAFLTKCAPSFE